MTDRPDRPPILRFLMLFAGLLTLATALAALSHAGDASAEAAAASESKGVAVSYDQGTRSADGDAIRSATSNRLR